MKYIWELRYQIRFDVKIGKTKISEQLNYTFYSSVLSYHQNDVYVFRVPTSSGISDWNTWFEYGTQFGTWDFQFRFCIHGTGIFLCLSRNRDKITPLCYRWASTLLFLSHNDSVLIGQSTDVWNVHEKSLIKFEKIPCKIAVPLFQFYYLMSEKYLLYDNLLINFRRNKIWNRYPRFFRKLGIFRIISAKWRNPQFIIPAK